MVPSFGGIAVGGGLGTVVPSFGGTTVGGGLGTVVPSFRGDTVGTGGWALHYPPWGKTVGCIALGSEVSRWWCVRDYYQFVLVSFLIRSLCRLRRS